MPVTIPARVHFVGIGGEGMSALAALLHARGHVVSGCDRAAGARVAALVARGIAVRIGHGPPPEADLVVASPAVREPNVALAAARARGVACVQRADLMGALSGRGESIGVAGSHGKTTTTGLVAQVLIRAGRDPSVVLGGRVPGLAGDGARDDALGARSGGGPLVFEACEGYRALERTPCTTALVLNVDDEHSEQYAGGLAELEAQFRRFVLAPRALTVVSGDDPRLAAWAREAPGIVTYGLGPGCDVRAEVTALDAVAGSRFVVTTADGERVAVALPLPGLHNVTNALAVIAAAPGLGLTRAEVGAALARVVAPRRRLETVCEVQGALVVDDYAHHPSEIAAGLAALRPLAERRGGRLVVCCEPTIPARVRRLAEGFAAALAAADEVVLLDVATREAAPEPGVTSALIARPLAARHRTPTHYVGTLAHAARHLEGSLRTGDVLVTMGSGAVGTLGPELVGRAP